MPPHFRAALDCEVWLLAWDVVTELDIAAWAAVLEDDWLELELLERLDVVDDEDELEVEVEILAALTDELPPRRAEGSVAPAQASSPVRATANKDESLICMVAGMTKRIGEERFGRRIE